MGKKVFYHRDVNIGFLIGDGGKLYPFQVGGQRDLIDKIQSDASVDLKNAATHEEGDVRRKAASIMEFIDFGKYLRCAPWPKDAETKERFKKWEALYSSHELIFGQKILDSDLTKFRLTGRDAQDPDTLDFIFNVLIDVDKSCEIRQIAYDYKDSESDLNAFTKEILNQWDDAEYRISYKKPGAGFLTKLFDRDGGLVNNPSIRRSDIECIRCEGTHEIFIESKHNTHVLSYQR